MEVSEKTPADLEAERMVRCLKGEHEEYCRLAPYGTVELKVCRWCRGVYAPDWRKGK